MKVALMRQELVNVPWGSKCQHDKKDKLPFASLASQAASLQAFNPSADNGYSVNFDASASTPAAFYSQTASPDVTLDKMKYVAYDVCASTRVKSYTGTEHPHAAFSSPW